MQILDKLLSIDLTQVQDEDMHEEVQSLREAYAAATHKEDFAEARQKSIEAVVEWVEEEYPEAFVTEPVGVAEGLEEPEEFPGEEDPEEEEEPEEEEAPKASPKTKPVRAAKPATKSRPAIPNPKRSDLPISPGPDVARVKVLEDLQMLEEDFERCEEAISLYKATRKAVEGEAEKPTKTRATKLREKLVAIAKLTPPNLQSDDRIQQQNRKVLNKAFVDLMTNWGMDKQVERGKKAFSAALEQVEDKFETKDRRALADRWKKDLPTEAVVKRLEKKKDEALSQRLKAIHKIVKEAIAFFRKDDDAAWAHLDANFSEEQIQKYLPKYILDYRTAQTK